MQKLDIKKSGFKTEVSVLNSSFKQVASVIKSLIRVEDISLKTPCISLENQVYPSCCGANTDYVLWS